MKVIISPIRQELLSGAYLIKEFLMTYKEKMQGFNDFPIQTIDSGQVGVAGPIHYPRQYNKFPWEERQGRGRGLIYFQRVMNLTLSISVTAGKREHIIPAVKDSLLPENRWGKNHGARPFAVCFPQGIWFFWRLYGGRRY
ncbi:MAG: hypothetical protein LBP76_02740 [Treponema sp.]|jgi:hypothetical protein|nr:hypothetical protein [Treponema sp.]